jgi:hypothetical protein
MISAAPLGLPPDTIFKLMARQAVSAWINTKYCPECGFVRKEGHAVGCLFPAMMGEVQQSESGFTLSA